MTNRPTTMILRFRDMGVKTVEEHQQVIADKGYVWWGWWHKPQAKERIPRNTFARFKQHLEANKYLDVYLADSGSSRFYRARLTAIQNSETDTPITCPEPDASPRYYSDRLWLAWYRFDAIEELPQSATKEWSYAEEPNPEFCSDTTGDAFDGKQVIDVEELITRERTIWFVRPFAAGDSLRELRFLPPAGPANFYPDPILAGSNYVLHLSDLHFGTDIAGTKKHGYAVGKGGPGDPTIAQLIIDAVKNAYNRPPAAVIVSGDLTYRGLPEEYQDALQSLLYMRAAWGLDSKQFIIIPGNHDIQWVTDPTDPAAGMIAASDDAVKNYREFYQQFFNIAANEWLSLGRRFILGNYTAVDIVGLNSARLEQEKFRGYGYVSLQQLNEAASTMGWTEEYEQRIYRILVLHHHLLPVAANEPLSYDMRYSLTLDAGQILYRSLELGLDLVCHGHMHQPFMSTYSRAVPSSTFPPSRSVSIHATGSAGVKRELTGAIGRNAFSVIVIDDETVEVQVFTVSEAAQRFEKAYTHYLTANEREGMRVVGEPK